MDNEMREKYLKTLVEKDKEALKRLSEKFGKKMEGFLNDILTVSVSTRYEGEKEVAAKTELYFDGDMDVIVPRNSRGLDRDLLDLHERTVDMAMKNRRELIRMFLQLFDLKNIAKII